MLDSGSYWSTCGNCAVRGSNVDFILTCDCLNGQGRFASSTYDLSAITRLILMTVLVVLTHYPDRVIWNHDGVLGCFNHIGNKTEKGPF